jgi:NADPH2:quinone reductase
MKAGVASPNGVVIQDVPEPKPKATDLLIKIKAIALNRADLGSAKGDTSHGAAAGKPIGSEFSGEVIEVGADVRDFKKGDRVMCHSPAATPRSQSAIPVAP